MVLLSMIIWNGYIIFFAFRLASDVNAIEIMGAFFVYLILESLRLMKQKRGKFLLNRFSKLNEVVLLSADGTKGFSYVFWGLLWWAAV